MSSTMYWKPGVDRGMTIPTDLKLCLGRQYNLSSRNTLDHGDIPYLEGLLHGGLESAQMLISAIETHGSIVILEQW